MSLLPASSPPDPPVIRPVAREDGETLLGLIDALADYERLARPDGNARGRLLADALGERRRFDAYLIESGREAVGYAIVFETYSSFLARPTLYLEDVFVLPERRRGGIGAAVMRFLAGEALRRGCGRMEWQVLAWNDPAICFYEKIGARRMDDWVAYRLTEEDLRRVGA